jgi:hypothetical protein
MSKKQIYVPELPSRLELEWAEPIPGVRHTTGGVLNDWVEECAGVYSTLVRSKCDKNTYVHEDYNTNPLDSHKDWLFVRDMGMVVARLCEGEFIRGNAETYKTTPNKPKHEQSNLHRDGGLIRSWDKPIPMTITTVATRYSTVAVDSSDVFKKSDTLHGTDDVFLIPGRSVVRPAPGEIIVITEKGEDTDPYHCTPYADKDDVSGGDRFFFRARIA